MSVVDSVQSHIVPTAGRRGRHRPDLDGLRVLATVMVIGYHVGLPGFRGAFVGLDLFFVLSGYLIVGLIVREIECNGRISWTAFFARRVYRLIPAAVLMNAGVLLISLVALAPKDRIDLANASFASTTSTANIYFWRHAAATNYLTQSTGADLLVHMWSLGVEEQFYLILPVSVTIALLLLAGRLGRRRALLWTCVACTAISALLTMYASTYAPLAGKYLLPTRAWEIGAGAIVVLAVPREGLRMLRRRWTREFLGSVSALTLGLIWVFPLPGLEYPGLWAAIPVAAAVLVVVTGGAGVNWFSRILGWRPLAAGAVYTYSIYLWHYPLIGMVHLVDMRPSETEQRLVAVAIAAVLSVGSYHLVERRFLERAHRAARERRTGVVAVVGAGIGALGLVLALAAVVLVQSTQQAEQPRWRSAAMQQQDHPSLPSRCQPDGLEPTYPARQVACDLTEVVAGRPTVVLWGDSHAWSLFPAVTRAATPYTNVVAWVAPGCPPYAGLTPAASLDEMRPVVSLAVRECDAHDMNALRYVKRLRQSGTQVRVVLAAAWDFWIYTSDNRDVNDVLSNLDNPLAPLAANVSSGESALVRQLIGVGASVQLILPTPEMPREAPICEARQWSLFPCDSTVAEVEHQDSRATPFLAAIAQSNKSVQLLDLDPAFCNATTCPAEGGGVVRFIDDNHLTAAFALTLAPYFGADIRRPIWGSLRSAGAKQRKVASVLWSI